MSRPPQSEFELANELHEIWLEFPYYGYRRLTAELQNRGYLVNHKRVARIMRDMNICAIYPKQRTSIPSSAHKKYPYLLRELVITRPNQVWATDITYIKLTHGFAFMIGIIDLFSRFLIAWKLSNTMETDFCISALNDALMEGEKPEILNTDQGAQFTSEAWIKQVEQNEIRVSMDGKGRWADNIFIERFWRTLKYEHIFLYGVETIREAQVSVEKFIEVYNYKRLHQSLGYKTPASIYLEQ